MDDGVAGVHDDKSYSIDSRKWSKECCVVSREIRIKKSLKGCIDVRTKTYRCCRRRYSPTSAEEKRAKEERTEGAKELRKQKGKGTHLYTDGRLSQSAEHSYERGLGSGM